MKDNIVIVIDLGNYKEDYREELPFKAITKDKYEHTLWVESLATKEVYELYYHQILEGLPIDQIKELLQR